MTSRCVAGRSGGKAVAALAAGWMAMCGLGACSYGQTDARAQREASIPTSAARPLAFEVISIRKNTGTNGPPRFGPTPDGFHSINMPLFAIFQLAYAPTDGSGPLRGDRVVGPPAWILGPDRYDVVAKVSDADMADWQKPQLKQTMLRAMLQAMLAERFKVEVHHESKEMPVFDLVVAKSGPKFKQAETADPDELRLKHPGGGRMTAGGMAVMSANETQLYGITMGTLAQAFIATAAGRPVVDKTGLAGSYDLRMPSLTLPPPPPGFSQTDAHSTSQPMDAPPPAGDSESIFTVLPEALGLRLEPTKGEVDMLVIDHVERPTEN